MNPATVRLLRNPFTLEALRFLAERDPDGELREWLVSGQSGRRFPVREGIPIFADEQAVSGANRKYQRMYDRIARGYDIVEKVVADLRWGGRDNVRQAIVKDIQIERDATVLEVSIGTGINLRYLPPAARYVGLDISFGMLRQCRRNLQKWQRQAELIQGMAEWLPFKDAAFDVVFHFGGINVFSDKDSAIAEMIRVAKPGAQIFIGDETEVVAQQGERSLVPFGRRFSRDRSEEISAPVALVPTGMRELKVDTIWNEKLYMLSFRKP